MRYGVLLAVLGYLTWEFLAHALLNKLHPSVHALCPLGGLESLLRFITSGGSTIGKVFSGTMGLFFVTVGFALVFRRSFCGGLCPLGTLRELAWRAGVSRVEFRQAFGLPADVGPETRWKDVKKTVLRVLERSRGAGHDH